MLLGGSSSNTRAIAIVVRNPLVKRLLSSILADWKFETVDDLMAARIVLVERGLALPEHEASVLWLSPMPLADVNFLMVPISLTRLYCQMEAHFFSNLRQHLRVAMDISADLQYDGRWHEARMISLSPRGCRFLCDVELPRKTPVTIEMKLAGKVIRTAAEVLYCVSASDSPGRQQPKVGVVFKPAEEQVFESLSRFVEKSTVEIACARAGIAFNDPCVNWIDFADDPWAEQP